MESYDTMTEALNALRRQGYTEDFNLLEDCLACRDGQFKVFADEFIVDKYFRFEGASDPDDTAILYAISSPSKGLKGVLVNAYGVYGDSDANDLMQKLRLK